jgi:hypothetical protein
VSRLDVDCRCMLTRGRWLLVFVAGSAVGAAIAVASDQEQQLPASAGRYAAVAERPLIQYADLRRSPGYRNESEWDSGSWDMARDVVDEYDGGSGRLDWSSYTPDRVIEFNTSLPYYGSEPANPVRNRVTGDPSGSASATYPYQQSERFSGSQTAVTPASVPDYPHYDVAPSHSMPTKPVNRFDGNWDSGSYLLPDTQQQFYDERDYRPYSPQQTVDPVTSERGMRLDDGRVEWGFEPPDNPWSSAARGRRPDTPTRPLYEVDPGAGNPWAFRRRGESGEQVWIQNPDRPWGRGEVRAPRDDRYTGAGSAESLRQQQRPGRESLQDNRYLPEISRYSRGSHSVFNNPVAGYTGGYTGNVWRQPFDGGVLLDPWGSSQNGTPSFYWQLPSSGWDIPYLPWNW